MKKSLLYEKESYKIIGCAIKVHKILGEGFLENVYQEALGYEFDCNEIPFEIEKPIKINYGDIVLTKKYIADFICYENIIIEIKALSSLSSEHESQVINYLKATGMRLGILINFGESSLVWRRIIL